MVLSIMVIYNVGIQNVVISGFLSVSSHGQPTRGSPPAWGLGEGLTTPHHKSMYCYETLIQKASDLD
jgi:hypothetical protein